MRESDKRITLGMGKQKNLRPSRHLKGGRQPEQIRLLVDKHQALLVAAAGAAVEPSNIR